MSGGGHWGLQYCGIELFCAVLYFGNLNLDLNAQYHGIIVVQWYVVFHPFG